jgi:hypothetical protein
MLAWCRGEGDRRDQPHRVVGVVKDRSKTRLVADAVPPLVVESRRGLFLVLRGSLPVPPCLVTGGFEKLLSLF